MTGNASGPMSLARDRVGLNALLDALVQSSDVMLRVDELLSRGREHAVA
jgi:hypothetical protein